MAIVGCPECSSEVSDSAMECPSCGVQLRKPTRSFFGRLIKWSFMGFNLLMLVWLLSYWGDAGQVVNTAASEAEQAGAAIGATLGTGMLLGLWAMGDLILGMLVLLSRPK